MHRLSPKVMSVVFAVLVMTVGCGGRTLGGPGVNNNRNANLPDSGVIPDAAIPPDSGPTGCASNQFEWLHPVPVDSIYPLQNGTLSEGQTMRLAVGFYVTGCQRPAQVDYQVEPTQRAVYVTAWVWETTGPQVECPDMMMYVEEILAFADLTPGDWRVAEQTSGVPGVEASFQITPCDGNADCLCENTPPGNGGYGDDCTFNCDCDPSLQCTPHLGMGGPFSICATSCTVDADCGGGDWCMVTDDGPLSVCAPAPGANQCPAGGCPPGYACLEASNGSMWCQAQFDMIDEGRACACPQDCPTGLTCVDFGGNAMPSCHAPCRGDRDCPGGMCGDYLPDTAPICIMMWM